ncbi:helix-turn-helix transcriptional regulator [Streptomyces sp. MT206]|uniref:helix-turn-helix transcriptional regulator n=1 Tax=Streptomyces sp. MT206 TaxID=3031407 RepID=UPI002FC99D38
MIESVPSLAVTLAQIRALAEERQLTAAEMLDVEDLAARTGVPPEVVAGLLRGEEDAAEAAPGETARRRAAFLCARSRDAAGHPYRAADIAEAIGAAPRVITDLVAGRAGNQPSEAELLRIAAFFGRDPGFLTDTPAQAVSRALQPVLRSLDHVSGGDMMAELVGRYGLVSLSTRNTTPGKPLTRTQETLLLGMITGILSSEGAS